MTSARRDRLRAFMARGQAAQKAVDNQIAALAGGSPGLGFPPWKRCEFLSSLGNDCQAWTRGKYCPRHRTTDSTEGQNETADVWQGGFPAVETHPPRGASGLGASSARRGEVDPPPRADARRASDTRTTKSGKQKYRTPRKKVQ